MSIEETWEAGRRQFVIDCLANDEFPYRGWDADYPDLAAQRLREAGKGEFIMKTTELPVASLTQPDACPDCGCDVEQHNTVNQTSAGLVAHCGSCGACWKSTGTAFTAQLLTRLTQPTPWCEPCASYHPVPRNAEHKADLGCMAQQPEQDSEVNQVRICEDCGGSGPQAGYRDNHRDCVFCLGSGKRAVVDETPLEVSAAPLGGLSRAQCQCKSLLLRDHGHSQNGCQRRQQAKCRYCDQIFCWKCADFHSHSSFERDKGRPMSTLLLRESNKCQIKMLMSR